MELRNVQGRILTEFALNLAVLTKIMLQAAFFQLHIS